MTFLNWDQVTNWRLSQHSLLERAGRGQMLDVVSQMGGVHAQLMSAAELQLWARVENLSSDDVQNALWSERTLVKTWSLRGTLHLLTARDFPFYVAALSTLKHFRRASWQKYHGVSLDELEALIEGLPEVLSDTGITREQLAEALATRTNTPKLQELLRSGWGALLKPAAFQGLIGFGPSEGQNVTFVQPRAWIGEWTPVEPETALQEVARHSQYLLPGAYKTRVYRPQGWISPVVLVNGRIEGVWEYDKQHSQITIIVEMFAPPEKTIQQGIEAEAARLGRFFGAEAKVDFS